MRLAPRRFTIVLLASLALCLMVPTSFAFAVDIDSLYCAEDEDSLGGISQQQGGGLTPIDSVKVLVIYVTFPDSTQDSAKVPYYYQTFEDRFAQFYDSLSFGKQIIKVATYLAPGDTTAVMADSISTWYRSNGGHGRLNVEVLEKVHAQSSEAIDTSDCIIVVCYETPLLLSFGNAYGIASLAVGPGTPYTLSFEWSGVGATLWISSHLGANMPKLQNYVAPHEYGHLLLGGLSPYVHSPNCDPVNEGRRENYYQFYSLMSAHPPMRLSSTPIEGFIPFHVMDLISLGWIEESEITTDTDSLKIRDIRVPGGKVYRLSIDDKQYFLVSNHQQTGFDRVYPGKGLLIWHIVQQFWEADFWDLECAHGMYTDGQPDPVSGLDTMDLYYPYNTSSASDFFDGSTFTSFDSWANPSSFAYDSLCHYGPQSTITRIAVENIHAVSDTLGINAISADIIANPYSGSTVTVNDTTIMGCPGWDADSLIFNITVAQGDGTPLSGIDADSVYTIVRYYCYGDTARADSSTNAIGKTTISLRQLGHGGSLLPESFEVWVKGIRLPSSPDVTIRTVDLSGNDCRVDSADSAEMFSMYLEGNCLINYDFDDTCGIVELAYPADSSIADRGDRNDFMAHMNHPIKVLSPNVDSSWAAGSQHQIAWTDGDGTRNNSYVTLFLSKDGGSSFPDTIAAGEANDGSYTWTIPADAESLGTYRVKAVVYDNVGGPMNHSAADTSDANFTITWGTPTCGTISSNTTWSGSIYVPCDVVVSSGAELTVSSGTLVRFAKSDSSSSGADSTKCELIVQGKLKADGTPESKPTFSSASSSPAAGDWRGIRLRPHNTNNLLDNCVIKYAYTGIEAESTTASVDSCTISYFQNDGIKAIASAVVIRKNTIELGVDGIRGIELTSSTTGEVSGGAGTGHHNSITCFRSDTVMTYGILSSGNASADLEYTWIDGVKYGIRCSGSSSPAIAHNWIKNTTNNGIQTSEDAMPSIRYITIEGTQGTGLTAIDNSQPYLGEASDYGYNRFLLSGSYTYYAANLTENTVKAEQNWWNSSSPKSNKFYGDVDYNPYLTSDPGASYGLPLLSPREIPPAEPYAVQNYPNPFNPTTTIEYGVSVPNQHVRIIVYDLVGRVITVLVDAPRPAGRYAATWDGRNANGEAVASGVYFYEVAIGGFKQAKKLVVMK